jgi:hypothetical protein
MRSDKEILEQFASSIIPELQKVSGRFADSIQAEYTAFGLDITASPFIRVLIDGRAPTRSGARKGSPTLQQIIKKWISDKGISSYADKNGRFPTPDQLSWAISNSIHKRGTLLYQRGGGNNIFDSIITKDRINALLALFTENYMLSINSIVKWG